MVSFFEICCEFYENVVFVGVFLDVLDIDLKFFVVIKYSINIKGKIFYKKFKEKREKGDMGYLRVIVGYDCGVLFGVFYVLEIWFKDFESLIYNYGNVYVVIKVLYGEIKMIIYNKIWKDVFI